MFRALRVQPDRQNFMQPGNLLQRSLELLPVFVAASMPKCPLCLMGLMSSLGISVVVEVSWLLPLTFGLLGISLALLAYRAWRRERFKPLMLGICAAIVFIIGKFPSGSPTLSYVGVGLLVVAFVWSSWTRAPSRATTDCSC